MATPQEIEAQKQAQKDTLTSQIIGTGSDVLSWFTPKDPQIIKAAGVGKVIEMIGDLAIAGVNFFVTKKRQEQAQKKKEAEERSASYIDKLLGQINSAGKSLVSQGLVPDTDGFEIALKNILYKDVGYCGYCNADLWSPPPLKNFKYIVIDSNGKETSGQVSATNATEAINKVKDDFFQRNIKISRNVEIEEVLGTSQPRFLWVKIENKGTSISFADNRASLPGNLITYWQTSCQNIRDGWISEFSQKLIKEGRANELQSYQQMFSGTGKTLQFAFGSIALVMLGGMIYLSMSAPHIKKPKSLKRRKNGR